MKKYYLVLAIVLPALIVSACNQPVSTPPIVTPTLITFSTPTPIPPATPTVVPPATATVVSPTTTSTSPVPLAAPTETATATPTATVELVIPENSIVIHGCPEKSLGYHPDTGEPLIFDKPGYPGDADVDCHYVIWSGTQPTVILLESGYGFIGSFWFHGTYNTDGSLNGCPEEKVSDPKCEGTYVGTGSMIVPAGVIMDVNLYHDVNKAHARFTKIGNPNFACEYVGNDVVDGNGNIIVHTEDNIIVPPFAEGVGTIYEFDRNLSNPQHCPDRQTDVSTVTVSEHCDAPNGDPWKWTGEYWSYSLEQATTFDVPTWIKVATYKNANSGEHLGRQTGEIVVNGVDVKAYCASK